MKKTVYAGFLWSAHLQVSQNLSVWQKYFMRFRLMPFMSYTHPNVTTWSHFYGVPDLYFCAFLPKDSSLAGWDQYGIKLSNENLILQKRQQV